MTKRIFLDSLFQEITAGLLCGFIFFTLLRMMDNFTKRLFCLCLVRARIIVEMIVIAKFCALNKYVSLAAQLFSPVKQFRRM